MATLQQLEQALVNADKAGDSDAARRLAAAVVEARKNQSGADLIPGQGAEVKPAPAPSIGDRLKGAGEAALSVGTSMLAQPVAALAGVNEFAGKVASALTGNQAAVNAPSTAAQDVMQAMTYQPRTDTGREYLGNVAEVAQALTPIAGLTGEAAALGQAVQAARPAGVAATTTARATAEGVARDVAGQAGAAAAAGAIDRTAQAVRTVQRNATTLPKRAWESITRDEATSPRPTPGTGGSVGAAATDLANQRIATAEQLGFTGDAALTKGQATRDAAQLKFEVETAKIPEVGGDLRARRVAQNDVLLRNFDSAIDQTGAEAPTLRAVGQAVDSALVKQFETDKAAVRRAYQQATSSPEASALVDMSKVVSIGEGERAITGTPLSFINQQPTGVPASALVDAARQYAVRLGIAEMRDGELIPRPASIRQLEQWRTAINEATGYEPQQIRQATILKGLIDAQTEPVAGPLYRNARNLRRRLAENYEDRAGIAKLLNDKRGTSDRQVALEDVFKHSMLDGSLDDVRNMRRVLHRSGAEGEQAWRELQGQTLKWLRDESTKSVAADGSGNRVLSPAALDRSIRALEHDGKLDFIFGKRGAQRLRDLNDIAQVAKTVPPESAINISNNAMTLLTGFADLGLSGISGIPAPLATATRLGLKHVKDAATRKRINEALAGLPRESAKTTN